MSVITNVKTAEGIKPADFCVVILFLLTAALSINMFRLDLLQTINLRNVESVGTVIIKKNVVQRRLADRILWDRLAEESPVYLGDLIRVADLSAATLYIDGASIDLSENTLIRLTRAADGEGLQIIMSEGNLSIAATPDSGRISLEVNGRQVQTTAGSANTVLNVTSAEDGMILQINEGNVQIIEEGRALEVSAGEKIVVDTGASVHEVKTAVKSAVVTNPVYNARFISESAGSIAVNFSWNKNNFSDNELLRLEISANRNFRRILHVRENLDRQAEIALNSGLWYWRLSYEGTVLDNGRFTITEGSGPQLQSPAVNSSFNYTDKHPVLNFRWDKTDDASSYIFEVSESPDFITTHIQRHSNVTFLSESSLGEGTWYWRVKPVFPPVYIGNPSYSQISHFRVNKITAAAKAEIETETKAEEELSLEEWLTAEIALTVVPEPVLPVIQLSMPSRGSRIDGLTAQRQQTIFAWECDAEIVSSRFVLSANTDPFQRTPVIVIENPGRNITVNTLDEGTWYWNIEAQTKDGVTISAAEHGVLHVTAVPNLSAPQNLQPARGRHISMNDLQTQRSVSFSWQAVRGANAYILTIFQESRGSRQQLFRSQPITRTNYNFDNLSILDRGTFIWQVEALSRRADGTIEQRGAAAESTFIMDIILPGAVRIDGAGVLDE